MRLEYSPRGRFENSPTVNVLDRRLAVPRYAAVSTDGWLTLKTSRMTLRYKVGSGPFTPANTTLSYQMGGHTARVHPTWEWECPFGQSCQAGSAVLSGGAAIATGQNGYESPAGYVSGLTKVGAASTWTVLGAPAGAATLAVRYTNYVIGEQPTVHTIELVVNGHPATTVPLRPTSANTWSTATAPVDLQEGTNSVRLECGPGNGCNVNLDTLALGPSGTPSPTPPQLEPLGGWIRSFDSYTYGRRDTCPSPGNCANHQALPIGKGSAVVTPHLRPVGRTAVCSTQGPMGRHASPLASDAACIGQSYSRSRRRVDRRTVDMARNEGQNRRKRQPLRRKADSRRRHAWHLIDTGMVSKGESLWVGQRHLRAPEDLRGSMRSVDAISMAVARLRGSGSIAPPTTGGVVTAMPGEVETTRPSRWRLNPHALGYLITPAALATILALRWFGLVAQESVWLWLAVFITIPSVSIAVDRLYRHRPTGELVHLRVAWHVAAVTIVIYLSGWGPVLVGAFAFVALENISDNGSRTWRMAAFWSLLGIAVGQLLIWQNWAPSFLSVSDAEALGLMGAFVLLFVIRMAGATMEQKEEAEDRFRSLVQHSSDTTLVITEGMVITYASPATTALLGTTPEKVIGRRANDLVHPDDRERVELQFASRLLSKVVTEPVQFRMAHADGSWPYVEAVVSDLRDRPSVAGYVANVRDMTERKEAEDLLAHQALHDPLTGLPNRTLILDRADQMMVRSRREFRPTAALYVDLDNFKDINDTLGHDAGDKVLQGVANRFSAILRAGDTVGRLGGDEFVVLAEGISLAAGPELVAERLLSVLREPFAIEGYEGTSLTLSASVGIAVGDRESAEDLLRDADIALYRAKALGKDRYASFEPEMQSAVLDRLELRMDLQSALANDEFFLLYQPIIDLENGSVCGVEALLRWHHPMRGMVLPGEFIPLLEETGLIVDVGRWVLKQACKQAAEWNRRAYHLAMSVNVSMRQLETDTFLDHVREALADSHLEPSCLVIEVTETTIMRDADATVRRLRGLKELGVLIAIDDFGTGYSSLAHLQQFPVDTLKIDKSFIAAMTDSPESAALIHTLVELGRALGLETIAEGIENHSQLEKLRSERCDLGQGFLFSNPVSPGAIEALLSRLSDGAAPSKWMKTSSIPALSIQER